MSGEKKLTDEEIVKALEHCTTVGMSCDDCPFTKQSDECSGVERLALNLIHRLQSENAEWQKDYIALDLECRELRTELDKELAEHEGFTQKAKAEIERLREESAQISQSYIEVCDINAELQKQVDELKEDLRVSIELLKEGGELAKMNNQIIEQVYEQAVTDTAKEIWGIVMSDECSVENTFDDKKFTEIIKERYGVEVE